MSVENKTDSLAPQTERFKFRGNAGEFFGIWFVNNILTMITLGFYSPWAKIRTLQYFYGNTELAGSSFQFTANPWKLLRSRVIAVLLLVLYFVSENMDTTASSIVFACLIIGYFVLAPVLLIFVLSFRTRYSIWRGVKFDFNRDYAGAYRVYLAPLAMLFILGASLAMPFYSEEVEQFFGMPHHEEVEFDSEMNDVNDQREEIQESPQGGQAAEESSSDEEYEEEYYLDEEEEDLYINPYLFIPFAFLLLIELALLPYFDFINMRFLFRNSRFGNGEFSCSFTVNEYYSIYVRWYAVSLVLAAMWFALIYIQEDLGGIAFGVLIILTTFYLIGTRAYLKSRRTNIIYNGTALAGHHKFAGYIPFWALLWLMVSNSLAVSFTLGLLGPWAKVRAARFMLDRLELQSTESLDGFIDQQTRDANSLAEEVADAFDLDLI